MKTLFLLGPTPVFYGDERATTSWRRDFVARLNEAPQFDRHWLNVVPEPQHCNWTSVDYDVFPEMPGLDENTRHVHAQVHWENWFIDMALENGIVALHAYLRWDGNAGPTVRLEAGKLLDRLAQNQVNACVINLPRDSQSVQYIEAHLLDASQLFRRGDGSF